jgi:hypothetical protein
MKTGRGQSAVVVALIVAFLALFGYLAVTTLGSKGYQEGADAIGESVGEVIDNSITTYDQDAENAIVQAAQALSFWLNSQKLVPNKHSIERHGADAWAATNCYNNNGFFQLWQVKNEFGEFDLHGLCRDSDGSILDVILRREGTSNRYNFINAFKPKKGILRDIIYWIKTGKGGSTINPPSDIIIYVDGIIP